ncbi:4Fe-4S domain-containing protein [Lentzea sp. NPDC051213]|uniref:4Fe-4S domain-containing protein n=1 Tax=Lentzea sp. NPDC051213 TaxID=3364126 RepID=UPI0037B6A154
MSIAGYLAQIPNVTNDHDLGVRAIAAFSARLTYVFMMLTVCWGILTATGWVRRLTGHQALRGGHMILASFTLATGVIHGVSFQFLDGTVLTWPQTVLPFVDNGLIRHGFGIVSLELMLAIALTAGMHRFFRYINWLRFHQLAYAAVALGAIHSWLGAYANGHVAVVWIAGITAAAPAITLCVLRVLPPQVFVLVGLLDAESTVVQKKKIGKNTALELSVDNVRCHRYGFCHAEAPAVFQLLEDGRLQYKQHPEVLHNQDVRSAVRACPTQAIQMVADQRQARATQTRKAEL